MKKILSPRSVMFLILIVSLCLPYSVYALSQERPERNHSFILEHLVDFLNFIADLDLTEEQKTTLKALITETCDTVKPLMGNMKELRSEMDEAILAEPIDDATATELNQEINKLKLELSTIVLSAKLKGAEVLTPEQRAMILEKKKEHRERMEEWRVRFREWRDFFSKLIFN